MKKMNFLSIVMMLAIMLVSVVVNAAPGNRILIFVGADDDVARAEDSVAIDSILSWYGVEDVVYMGSSQFNDATADDLYTDAGTNADGVIISESIGSTSVPNFGLRDDYPVPVLIMEGVLTNDAASTEKWPLLLPDPDGGIWGYGTPEAVDVQWKITDETHEIIEGYAADQIINYAPEAGRGVPYLHGIDASHQILATAARTDGGADNPTFVQSEAIGLAVIDDPKIVYMNVAYTYLAVGTTDFYNIVHRSCDFLFELEVPESIDQNIADQINLSVFPNPAHQNVSVTYYLEQGQNVSMNVYNVAGGLLENVHTGISAAGKNVQNIDVANYASGIYFVELNIGNEVVHSKMVVR